MDADERTRFPLQEAYTFAFANGLEREASEIRDMEIEWDRSYTSTVRREKLLRLFEAKGLLSKFVSQSWPSGDSPRGESEKRFCLRIADEYDAYLGGARISDGAAPEADETVALQFALEAHLRDFLVKNLDHLEPGLRLYVADDRKGVEFPVHGGRIDILATDKKGKFVVVELKLAQGRNKGLGQLLYYMGWVDQNLGNGPCRGVIVASEIPDELLVAVSRASDVSLARYRMSFSIENVVRKRGA